MIALLVAVALAQTPLEAARAEALRYPTDYASQVRLAEQAGAAGRYREAFAAWTAALHLSDRNLESSLGRSVIAAAIGEGRTSLTDAQRALELSPEQTSGWMTRAWAWRNVRWMPGFGFERAAADYRQVLEMEPRHASAMCGLGWMQAMRGHRIAARSSFARTEELGGMPCGRNGLRRTAPAWTGWGTLSTTGSAYQNRDVQGALVGHLSAGAQYDELLTLQLTGRGLGFFPSGSQFEVWGQASVAQGGHGLRLSGAGGFGEADGTTVLGVEAWTTWWATIHGGFVYSTYDDGRVFQGIADLRTPWTPVVSTTVGLGLTTFRAADLNDPPEDDAVNLAGRAILDLEFRRFTLSAGGRFGPEYRPVRLDDPSLYNHSARIGASGLVRATVFVTDVMDVHLGYEVLRLQPPADPTNIGHQHLFTLGLTLHPPSPRTIP